MQKGLKSVLKFCNAHKIGCATIALVSLLGFGATAQSLWENSLRTKVPNKAYFPVKDCINMGGGLEASYEGEWGYVFYKEDFATIKNAGFDTVRIPIKWSAHSSFDRPFTIDKDFLARVDQIVSWGLEQNLNVIINVHHYDELFTNPDVHEQRLKGIWAQLSKHYRNAPPNLIFEIINEPQEKFSGSRVNETQNAILANIRKNNPTRTVILAGDTWGAMEGMYNLRLPVDPYIVATVHYYNPFEFTVQGAEWMKEKAPPKGRNFPIKDDLENLDKDVKKIVEWRTRLGIPVFIGEYGTDIAVPYDLRIKWAEKITNAFQAEHLPLCYFNFSNGFDIYDRKTGWKKEILDVLKTNQ